MGCNFPGWRPVSRPANAAACHPTPLLPFLSHPPQSPRPRCTLAAGPVSKLRLLADTHHSSKIAFVEFADLGGALKALDCSGALLGALGACSQQERLVLSSRLSAFASVATQCISRFKGAALLRYITHIKSNSMCPPMASCRHPAAAHLPLQDAGAPGRACLGHRQSGQRRPSGTQAAHSQHVGGSFSCCAAGSAGRCAHLRSMRMRGSNHRCSSWHGSGFSAADTNQLILGLIVCGAQSGPWPERRPRTKEGRTCLFPCGCGPCCGPVLQESQQLKRLGSRCSAKAANICILHSCFSLALYPRCVKGDTWAALAFQWRPPSHGVSFSDGDLSARVCARSLLFFTAPSFPAVSLRVGLSPVVPKGPLGMLFGLHHCRILLLALPAKSSCSYDLWSWAYCSAVLQ